MTIATPAAEGHPLDCLVAESRGMSFAKAEQMAVAQTLAHDGAAAPVLPCRARLASQNEEASRGQLICLSAIKG
jgi:hypothetical protein